MSFLKLTPQFLGAVRLQSALMGMALAFKEKYGEEALTVAKTFVEQLGMQIGQGAKKREGVVGSSVNDIERVLHAWQDPFVLGPPPKSRIEGQCLTMTRESPTQCPALHVAREMNLPLEMVCNNVAFPMFRGVVRAVNPTAKHTNTQLSANKCIDTIEVL